MMKVKPSWPILTGLVGIVLALGLLLGFHVARQKAKWRYVEGVIASLQNASEQERAERLWELCLKIDREGWLSKQRYHGRVCEELDRTPDAWLDVMVQEIRSEGPGQASAVMHLPGLGRGAAREMASLLAETDSDTVRLHALLVLCELTLSPDLTDEDKRLVLQAVRPLRDAPKAGVRDCAIYVIENMRVDALSSGSE